MKHRMDRIVRYGLSKDKKGLLAYFDRGTYYHIHSNELTRLEKWIHKMLKKIPKLKYLLLK
jgi:hypothetical protein